MYSLLRISVVLLPCILPTALVANAQLSDIVNLDIQALIRPESLGIGHIQWRIRDPVDHADFVGALLGTDGKYQENRQQEKAQKDHHHPTPF